MDIKKQAQDTRKMAYTRKIVSYFVSLNLTMIFEWSLLLCGYVTG